MAAKVKEVDCNTCYLNKARRRLSFKSVGPMKRLSRPYENSLLHFFLILSSLVKGRVVNNNDQTLIHKASIRMKPVSCNVNEASQVLAMFFWVHFFYLEQLN